MKNFFRIFLLILSLALCLSFFAFADDDSGVYVGGTELESGQYLSSSGSVSSTAPSGGYAHFLSENGVNTLTLSNFHYSGQGTWHSIEYFEGGCGIFSQEDLKIVLIGSNSITMSGENSGCIMSQDASFDISGQGDLSLSGGRFCIRSFYGDIRMDLGGDLSLEAGNTCVFTSAWSELHFNIGGDLSLSGSGFFSAGGNTVVTVGGDLTAEGGTAFQSGESNIALSVGGTSTINCETVFHSGGDVEFAGFDSISIYSDTLAYISGGTGYFSLSGEGSFSYTMSGNTFSRAAVECPGDIRINRNGSIEINAVNGTAFDCGGSLIAFGNGDITIDVQGDQTHNGVFAGDDIALHRDGNITVTTDNAPCFEAGGDINLDGSGDVKLAARKQGDFSFHVVKAGERVIIHRIGDVEILADKTNTAAIRCDGLSIDGIGDIYIIVRGWGGTGIHSGSQGIDIKGTGDFVFEYLSPGPREMCAFSADVDIYRDGDVRIVSQATTSSGIWVSFGDARISASGDCHVGCRVVTDKGFICDVPCLFSDVPHSFWGAQAVNLVSGGGLVKGYEDGSFRPNKAITLAELATIIYRANGYELSYEGYWAYDAINYCINTVGCMPDFGPITEANYNKVCTREVAVYMMVNGVKADFGQPDYSLGSDCIPDYEEIDEKYRAAVLFAYRCGLVQGKDEQGTFAPKASFTRAEMVTIFCNAGIISAAGSAD